MKFKSFAREVINGIIGSQVMFSKWAYLSVQMCAGKWM